MKLEYLEQFLVYVEEGTLTRAAEKLFLSQSTLTRNMYSLEKQLGVTLFQRKSNRLELTLTGKYSVARIKGFLEEQKKLTYELQKYEKSNENIVCGVCTPGVVWKIENSICLRNNNIIIEKVFSENKLREELKKGKFDLIVTSEESSEKDFINQYYFSEQLYLSVPNGHPYSNKSSISFDKMKGLTLLLREEIGSWESLISELNEIQFIRQKDNEFTQLVEKFLLPTFSTDISQHYGIGTRRVNILIKDKNAKMNYYIFVLEKNKQLLKLFKDNIIL